MANDWKLNVHNQFEKLNNQNYDTWSLLMKSVLVNADLWNVTNGVPASENTDAWTTLDSKALATIILHVSTSQLIYVKRCRSSWEAWQTLLAVHRPSGPIRKVSLYKKLLSHRMSKNDNIANYINEFSELIDKIEEIEIKLGDELKTIILLSSLPIDFDNFVIAIETRDVLPKFEVMKLKLLEEGERRNQKTNQNVKVSQQAFFVHNEEQNVNTSKKKAFNGKCYNCGRRGHTIQFCKSKKQPNNQRNESQQALSYAACMVSESMLIKALGASTAGLNHTCVVTKIGFKRSSNKNKILV